MADEAKGIFQGQTAELSQIQALLCECCHGNSTVRAAKQRAAGNERLQRREGFLSPVGTWSRGGGDSAPKKEGLGWSCPDVSISFCIEKWYHEGGLHCTQLYSVSLTRNARDSPLLNREKHPGRIALEIHLAIETAEVRELVLCRVAKLHKMCSF